MAYMSQEKKAKLAPAIKKVLNDYGMKGTISVKNHSTLVVTLSSGPMDIIGNSYRVAKEKSEMFGERLYVTGEETYDDVNVYHIDSHYTGRVKKFLSELYNAMMNGNHNNSDIQTDYFDVGWYCDVSVGTRDKPYSLKK